VRSKFCFRKANILTDTPFIIHVFHLFKNILKKTFPRRPVMEWTWGTAKKVAACHADRRCATDRLLTCFWPINSPGHQVQIPPAKNENLQLINRVTIFVLK
jgi:hypothetical protein